MNISATAAAGARNVTVTTGGEVVTLTNGFTVTNATPLLTQINPNTAVQGQQNVSVALTGQFTHFVQGTTTALFAVGVAVASLTVNSATSATAVLNISSAAPPGAHNVTVATGAEVVTLTNGFTITNGTPVLTQVSPNTGRPVAVISPRAATITFDNPPSGLTPNNFFQGAPVGASSQLTNQFENLGVIFSTFGGAPYAALIDLTGQAPSGTNGIGAVKSSGNVDYTQDIDIFLVDPGTTTPAVTDFISIQGDEEPISGNVIFSAYDINRNLIASGTQPDTAGGVYSLSAPGIHEFRLHSETGTVAYDNLSFDLPAALSGLSVALTGQFTHFAQGTSVASFGAGISILSLNVDSATSATAVLNIAANATPGPRNVTVSTGGEVVTLANGFTVTNGIPVLTRVNANTASQAQQNLSVALTGQFTHFVQGTSVASFGAGISVASVTVNSASSATAVLNIAANADLGARDVTVSTGTEVVTLPSGFTVTDGAPVLTQVNPNSGLQGQQNLSVTLTGQSTHFSRGNSVASFGPGISIASVTVTTPTSATAVLNIAANAAPGARDVTITTGTETAAFASGFTVVPGTPVIILLSPTSGQQGQSNLALTISGSLTHFSTSSLVTFTGIGITVGSVISASATSLTVPITIAANAPPGVQGIRVTTGPEAVSLANAFTVVAATAPTTILSVLPQTGLQGQTVQVAITGQNTHFQLGITTANFGPAVSVGGGLAGRPGPVTVTSPTTATAQLAIAASAPKGPRTVAVQTGTEQVSLVNGFGVVGSPFLLSLSPDVGHKAQSLSVTIQAAYTNFQPGVTTANFGPGISVGGAPEGVAGPVTVVGPNTATANISIDPAAALGLRSPLLQTGTEKASLCCSGFLVLGPVTGAPPVVTITSPAEAQEITGLTTVTGTVSSPNLASWTLDYLASGSTEFTSFAQGTASTVTGTFDPTILLNGQAQIRLTGVDQSGQTTSTSVNVVLTRNAKVGNFTLSFLDLNVPVLGIPLEAVRTYDSRFKAVGDFGFGWTLDVHTLKVDVNGILGDNWTGTVSGGFFPEYCIQPSQKHVVSVRIPGGQVYQFQPTINGACEQILPPSSVDMNFTPVGSTPANATLVAVNSTGLLVSGSFPGKMQLVDLDTLTSFDPDQFILGLPDGRQLTVSRTFGLQAIQDNNNNSLTISSDGITSSSGKSVTFARDAHGRITLITDPSGNTLQYAYDANGDLATSVDQNGNTSQYTYDGAHYLLAYKDPAGVQPMRNVYDDAGRLIQQINAFGNVLNFTNSVAANTETITDALGNPTTYVYDGAGNIISETDPLGNVTTQTFDANGNLLSVTNPLGKVTTYTYDVNNNQTTQTDPLGHTTRLAYNAQNQALTVKDPDGNVTTNNYDANGNLLSTTDPLGRVVSSAFDSAGDVLSSTDPAGATRAYTYDPSGNVTSITDAAGDRKTYTYDANGNRLTDSIARTTPSGPQTLTTQNVFDAQNRCIKTIFPDGSSKQIQYNALGKLSAVIDELGRETTYSYDNAGRQIGISYPDGTQESTVYDADGNRIQTTSRSGAVTTYSFDAAGRQVSTTDALLHTTRSAYDAAGQLISTTDALGNVTRYFYDDAGRRTKVVDALGNATTYSYDAAGHQISMTDANAHTTSAQFDSAGRRTRVTYPDDTFESLAYSANGNVASRTDAAGKTTQFGYDVVGRLLSVTDALGQVTRYTYDEIGERLTQTDANDHTTTYQYDERNRRILRTLPSGQSESYVYDTAGNITSRTDFNGKTTTFGYDPLNRLLSKTPDPSFSAPPITYTYSAAGLRTSMTDGSGTTSYLYDALNNPLTKVSPQGTINYAYDANSNLTQLKSGSLTVNHVYDQLNRLASVAEASTGTTSYTYDAVGNLKSVAQPNGVVHTYSYDSNNRLSNLAVTRTGTNLAAYTYTTDAVGHRLTVAELSGRTVAYTYDKVYRLTSETVANGPGPVGSVTYTYDPVGNRKQTASSLAGISPGLFAYDPDDRLSTDTYDSNGSTVSSEGVANVYDYNNHMIQHGSVTMAYDGDGNRVSKTANGVTTTYLWDTMNPTGLPQILRETSSDGSSHTYVYGLERVSQQITGSSPQISFYIYDGHGDVRMLASPTGTITDSYDYDAFGNLLRTNGSTPNHFLYTGEEFDPDLGLYYLRSRYLKTATGRFFTMDTVEGDPQSPASLHKYMYAGADPVNHKDPRGTQFDIGELSLAVAIVNVLVSSSNVIVTGIVSLFRGLPDAVGFGGYFAATPQQQIVPGTVAAEGGLVGDEIVFLPRQKMWFAELFGGAEVATTTSRFAATPDPFHALHTELGAFAAWYWNVDISANFFSLAGAAAGGFFAGSETSGNSSALLFGVSNDSDVGTFAIAGTAIAESSGEMSEAAMIAAADGFEGAFTAANLYTLSKDGVPVSGIGAGASVLINLGAVSTWIAYTYGKPK